MLNRQEVPVAGHVDQGFPVVICVGVTASLTVPLGGYPFQNLENCRTIAGLHKCHLGAIDGEGRGAVDHSSCIRCYVLVVRPHDGRLAGTAVSPAARVELVDRHNAGLPAIKPNQTGGEHHEIVGAARHGVDIERKFRGE